eukprot:13164764-Alexandrium_andersonii.AAC.1
MPKNTPSLRSAGRQQLRQLHRPCACRENANSRASRLVPPCITLETSGAWEIIIAVAALVKGPCPTVR